ncbi:cytochrome d ubiquinol oxidase subunit II [Nocardia thraciensis]
MSLPEFWFLLIGVLFTGYFVLEGFDFGVGMLMPILGRGDETRKRVLLNTIGPVWDGNEVWLLVGGGAMFAAFPEWYASLFSGFYLALFLILVGLITRACAIEWRGKINDPKWRFWADIGIGLGSWIPAFAWGLAFADIVHGVQLNADKRIEGGLWGMITGYGLLGGLTTLLLFLLHGTVFVSLKTSGDIRTDAVKLERLLWIPTTVAVAAFGLWTQFAHGKGWTWAMVALAVVGLVLAGAALYLGDGKEHGTKADGWAFFGTALTIVGAVVLLFGSLYPNVLPSSIDAAYNLTIDNASSTHYTLKIMSWCAVILTPMVLIYQGWTYWVFRKRLTTDQIPPSIGLPFEGRTVGAPRS